MAPADRVTLGPAPPPALSPLLRLVHEDSALLVIEKPPGLLTIGTEHERERTAYRLVWAYLKGARPAPPAVHRPSAGPGDLGAPGRREDPRGEAEPPDAVRHRHRGAALRRDRRGRRRDGRGDSQGRPPGGALASRPPRRPEPASAARRPGAHRDHPLPRDRAASGRDARGAPPRNRPTPPDPGPAGEARSPRRRGRPPRRAPGPAPQTVSPRHAGSPSAIRTPGRRSSSTARRPPRSPTSGARPSEGGHRLAPSVRLLRARRAATGTRPAGPDGRAGDDPAAARPDERLPRPRPPR